MPKQLIFHVHPSFRLACLANDTNNSYQVVSNNSAPIEGSLQVPTYTSWFKSVLVDQAGLFEELIFFVHSDDFLILPKGDFEIDLLFDKLLDNSGVTSNLVDHFDKDLAIDYKMEEQLIKDIEDISGNHPTTFHFLGKALINLSRKFEENTLAISIYGSNLNIAYCEKGEFKYYNQFHFENEQELLYFVLLAFKELNLDTEEDAVVIYGLVEENGALFQMLYQYIRNITIAEASDHYDLTYDQSMLSLHYFEPILSTIV